ncbi:MAG TPA: NYN domain-containing protein [Pirellulales bacterium]|nr:NYN domain-containing protein [Pirellulales bacterium]
MRLLIDGYNLMHAAGIIGRGVGPGGLERSRLALLNFVAESLDEDQRVAATVVFDARGAPHGLPATLLHRGLTVRFAAGYEEADELIEELIRAESAPRRLTVVSTDHRLQRAARRRRATAIDSEQWYADVLRGRGQRPCAAEPAARPNRPIDPSEVEFWLAQFDEASENQNLNDDAIFPPGYAEDIEQTE